jgi:hypothetical protein
MTTATAMDADGDGRQRLGGLRKMMRDSSAYDDVARDGALARKGAATFLANGKRAAVLVAHVKTQTSREAALERLKAQRDAFEREADSFKRAEEAEKAARVLASCGRCGRRKIFSPRKTRAVKSEKMRGGLTPSKQASKQVG